VFDVEPGVPVVADSAGPDVADCVAVAAGADRTFSTDDGDAGAVVDGSACWAPTTCPTLVPDDVEPEIG